MADEQVLAHEMRAPTGRISGIRNVLVVAPHPDDAELGVGGTMLALIAAGHTVHMLDMTNGEPTPRGDVSTRAKESAQAAKILGVASRTTLDLPNRYLMDSLDARTKVAEVIRRIRPDVLFVPYWEDSHPDHVQTSIICDAARFQAKYTKTKMAGEPWFAPRVFYYLCSHLKLLFPTSFIVDISAHWERKVEAAKSYVSQFQHDDGSFPVIDVITNYAKYYGTLIHADYGEPITVREPVGVLDFRDII